MNANLNYRAYSIRLRPGAREEYLKLHQGVWKEVEDTMHRVGVEEYRIFITGDEQLFALIGFRPGCDMQTLVNESEKNEACRRWNALTASMQERCAFAKENEWWAELQQAYIMK